MVFYIVLGGCTNPFSTRTPEEPNISEGDGVSDARQTDPDALFDKFKNSFSVKNVSHYQECLADDQQGGMNFIFIPENREFSRLTNWTKQDEINYFNKIINTEEIQEIELVFSDRSDVQIATDTLETQMKYDLNIQFRTKTENFQGRSILKILRSSSSLWYIYYWEDLSLNSNIASNTWSTVKADYRY
jgi:hypothetical protein